MSSQLSSASQIAFPFIKKDEVLISEQLVKGSKVCKTSSEWFSSKSTQEHQPGSPSCPVDQLKLSFHDRTHAAFLPILPGEKNRQPGISQVWSRSREEFFWGARGKLEARPGNSRIQKLRWTYSNIFLTPLAAKTLAQRLHIFKICWSWQEAVPIFRELWPELLS